MATAAGDAAPLVFAAVVEESVIFHKWMERASRITVTLQGRFDSRPT
jgi:hypothetical protein